MPEDLTTDAQLRPQSDEFGDVQTVVGDDNVRQQIRLAVTRELANIETKPLTNKRKRKLRRKIRTALEDAPYVDAVVAVKLFTPASDDEQLSVEVETRSDDISFTL